MTKYCRAPAPGASPNNGRVLVVEDDFSTRELLRRILHDAGWTVQTATQGAEGLAVLRDQPPDLILTDLMMPEMDGFESIRQVRAGTPGATIPIIVLTARDLDPRDRAHLNGYVARILQKGQYRREELLQDMQRTIGRPAPQEPPESGAV